MTYPDYIDIARGSARGARGFRLYGRNSNVGGTLEPISVGGIYRTPQVGSETALRIKAGGNANDAAAGLGARLVRIEGVNALGEYISEDVATNGTGTADLVTYIDIVEFTP